jgi:hypothetical protein
MGSALAEAWLHYPGYDPVNALEIIAIKQKG